MKSGTAQSSIVSSVVSFNVLTAHTLFVICLALSSMGLLFSEQSLKSEVSNFESILDVKSNIILYFCKKSKPSITSVISDLTTTKGCAVCSSPIHNGSVMQPNIGILSPEADVSCNPDGDILFLSENGAAILS